jgi:hypothetical protein
MGLRVRDAGAVPDIVRAVAALGAEDGGEAQGVEVGPGDGEDLSGPGPGRHVAPETLGHKVLVLAPSLDGRGFFRNRRLARDRRARTRRAGKPVAPGSEEDAATLPPVQETLPGFEPIVFPHAGTPIDSLAGGPLALERAGGEAADELPLEDEEEG